MKKDSSVDENLDDDGTTTTIYDYWRARRRAPMTSIKHNWREIQVDLSEGEEKFTNEKHTNLYTFFVLYSLNLQNFLSHY